jgi:outer membrane protein assembly factor BamD (BamD/ComL family)
VVLGIVSTVAYDVIERRQGEAELYQRADASWQQKRYEEAMKYYERLLSRYPQGKMRERTLLEAANTSYYYLRNVHRSIELYQELLKTSSAAAAKRTARMSLAEIYIREVEDLGQALEMHKAMYSEAQNESERQETGFQLAEAHLKRNEIALALGVFERVAQGKADEHMQDKAFLRIGQIQQMQRNPQAASAAFEKVIQHTQCDECRFQAKIGLVDVLEGQEKFDAAIAVLASIQGTPEMESMKVKEIKRIAEKRSVLHTESALNWSPKTPIAAKGK